MKYLIKGLLSLLFAAFFFLPGNASAGTLQSISLSPLNNTSPTTVSGTYSHFAWTGSCNHPTYLMYRIDGVPNPGANMYGVLPASPGTGSFSFNIGPLSAGLHTIQIIISRIGDGGTCISSEFYNPISFTITATPPGAIPIVDILLNSQQQNLTVKAAYVSGVAYNEPFTLQLPVLNFPKFTFSWYYEWQTILPPAAYAATNDYSSYTNPVTITSNLPVCFYTYCLKKELYANPSVFPRTVMLSVYAKTQDFFSTPPFQIYTSSVVTRYVTFVQASPPTISISANPTSVPYGSSTTLTWLSTDTMSCSGSGGIFSGLKALSGSEVIPNLTTSTTYIITCLGIDQSGVSSSVFVSVIPPPLPTISITAIPASIPYGDTSTLNWTSSNASSCTASGQWTGSQSLSGSLVVSPALPTNTYTLTCTGPGGSASASAIVTVTGSPLPTVSITAIPASIPYGDTSTLNWTSSNVTSCTASGQWAGSQSLSGSLVVSPAFVTNTYTLTCTGPFGPASGSAVVIVTGFPPPTINFSASPVSIIPPQSSTLTWSTANTTSCTGSDNSPTSPTGWVSITSSSDGTKLAVGPSNNINIYTSINSGVTWTSQASSGMRNWYFIASSADGVKLAAVVNNGYIYTSTDSGATWTQQTTSGSRRWSAITSSSDGTMLAAVVNNGYIYTSTDSGATWTQRTSSGSRRWSAITSSSDGVKLAAGVDFGYIYTSTDSGATWTQRTAAGNRIWYGITSSSDGTKLAAAVLNGYIYTSADSGATWTQRTTSGSRSWRAITSSSDGTNLAAVVNNGYIYTSTDSGVTWTQQTNAGSRAWTTITSSSDGTKLAAAISGGDGIYTSTDSGITWTPRTGGTAPSGWSGAKALSGTWNVSPLITTIYTLSCTGGGGNTSSSVTVSICGNNICEKSNGENVSVCRQDCPMKYQEF